MAFTPDFEFVHMGVNCGSDENAVACAKRVEALFGIPVLKNKAASCFSGREIEYVKSPTPYGTYGHIGFATSDVVGAKEYLESQGVEFIEESRKLMEDGSLKLIYLKEEIGGFAIHIMQREN